MVEQVSRRESLGMAGAAGAAMVAAGLAPAAAYAKGENDWGISLFGFRAIVKIDLANIDRVPSGAPASPGVTPGPFSLPATNVAQAGGAGSGNVQTWGYVVGTGDAWVWQHYQLENVTVTLGGTDIVGRVQLLAGGNMGNLDTPAGTLVVSGGSVATQLGTQERAFLVLGGDLSLAALGGGGGYQVLANGALRPLRHSDW